jgi:dipeptidyl aminopeptidase/acylaminoacyl peptidase
MARPGYEADRFRVVLLERASGTQRVLTEKWDRSPGSLAWSPDGATLYTEADNVGNHSLFAIDAAQGGATLLVEQGFNTAPARAGERLVFLQDTLDRPAELHSIALDGSDVRAITAINAPKLARCRMGTYEQYSFKGAKSETVYAWIVRPVGFDIAKFDPGSVDLEDPEGRGRYPVAFLIHGGPQGSFGDHFHYRWNPQAYAGAGYAAVMIDFHGSTGYGQAFTDAINGDWGGAPYEDLM